MSPAGKLTKLGRRLAELPVDPRMGRMILEADRLGCANEVLIIAAALSIQDVRERPSEKTAQADQSHARFADEDSDFISYLNLWNYLQEQQRRLSSNQFRKRCLAEYLHHLRVREWQDLVQQLRDAAKGVDVRFSDTPAEPGDIHRALLSGLLSHVGMKDPASREYTGARGARFAIFPGSGLFRKTPPWVMVAELVETTRLWGRTAARIDPRELEPLAGHLVKRTYSEPRWDARRGSVVATERVTLYGLPIVTDRRVDYGRIDPELSRELFIRRALVEGDWETRHAFAAENARLVEEVEALEARSRRRDMLVDDQARFAFFDARVPASVVSAGHFDRWWREERLVSPDLLTYSISDLVREDASGVSERDWPLTWKQGDLVLDLSYRFEPGAEDDGVTVHVPLQVLGELRSDRFEWLVPGLREELVTTLLRGLPKELRRPLVPVPETAAAVLDALRPRRRPLAEDMSAAVEAARGVRVPADAWDFSRLPPHLRVTFRVEDERRGLLASGRDLAAVRAAVRPQLRAELTAAASKLERTGLTAWDIGSLPREVTLRGTGQAVRAYPALVDEGSTAGVKVLETPAAQAASMWAGTRRLLLLSAPSVMRSVTSRLDNTARLALSAAPHESVSAVLDDAAIAAVDALMREAGGPAWDEAGWLRLRNHVAGALAPRVESVLKATVAVLQAAREVSQRLEPLTAVPLQPARADVRAQLARLVHPGFIAATGADRLPDVERYLRAAARRLERLPDATAVDRDRMNAIHQLERSYRERLAASPGAPGLREVPWMLEELRVSQFAQALGVKGPISAKRVRRALDEAALSV